MAKTKAAPQHSPAVRLPDLQKNLKKWLYNSRIYIFAFFLPVLLMCVIYAIFGHYPFGEKSVLALDLNAQYVYYFETLRDAFWGDGSVFYSWSRNLSGGFMGIVGYYLASPFTLIVMLLPRKMILTSLLLMILCKIGSAGVTFCLYLQKSRGIRPFHALVFSTLYALMAYMVIQTIDPMWLDGLVLLPLIILGTEYLVDDGRKLNFIIPLALMFIANFYIGYMVGIFAGLYFIYYLFFGTPREIKGALDYRDTLLTFVVGALTAVMCAAFMILPVYYSLQLGKFNFSEPDYSFTTQFNPVDILAQLLTCQFDSVNVQGSPEIYCGILTAVLLPLFFLNSRISMKKKMGHGFLLAAMFFSMYIKPVDMLWHGGQVPNWLPFRYSFIVSFVLLTMAAAAFKELEGVKLSHFGGVFFAVMGICLYINDKEYEHLDVMRSVWMSIGLSAVYLTFLYLYRTTEHQKLLSALTLCVISGELVFNGVFTMRSVDEEIIYSTRASYESFVASGREAVKIMEEIDGGLYRSEKTYTRAINDNAALGLRGMTHSSSVMNARILTFIQYMGYSSRSYYSQYAGTTELSDSLLGIKYVLDRGDTPARPLLHDSYTKVGDYTYDDYGDLDEDGEPRERTISICRNPNALSIGYAASRDILRIAHLGNRNPFESQSLFLSTAAGFTDFYGENEAPPDAESDIAYFTWYFTPVDVGDPQLGAVKASAYEGQIRYTKEGEGDPTITYTFTADSDRRVYAYLKTREEQPVNLWLGEWDDQKGDYRFRGFGNYFEGGEYCILDLGRYAPGTRVALRLTVRDDPGYTVIETPEFYYFDEDLYQADIDRLKSGQLEITDWRDDYIKGTVTMGEGQLLLTSIPYEPGWTVKVDGKKVDTLECMSALLAVEMSPGEHTVTFRYIPPGLPAGIILLILGIGMLVMFYRFDRENNPVLLARRQNREHTMKK